MHLKDAIRRERPYRELSALDARLLEMVFSRSLCGEKALDREALAFLASCDADEVSRLIYPRALLALDGGLVRVSLLGLAQLEHSEAYARLEELDRIVRALTAAYAPEKQVVAADEIFEAAEIPPERREELSLYLLDAKLLSSERPEYFALAPSRLARDGLPEILARLVGSLDRRDAMPSPAALEPPGPFELRFTGFEVERFRALRDFRVVLPSALTVFVGVNGAGKSTALDALAFVARALSEGLESALDAEGGFARLKSRGRTGPISIGVDFQAELGGGASSGRYELSVDERYGQVQVERERLITRGEEEVLWLERERAVAQVRSTGSAQIETAYPHLSALHLGGVIDPRDHPILCGVRQDFGRVLLVDRDPLLSQRRAEEGRPGAPPASTFRGRERWAAAIDEILDEAIPDQASADRLASVLSELVPTIREIRRDAMTDDLARFEIIEIDSPEPMRIDELSAGMRQMLVLSAIYLHPEPPSILLLEEPDAGIHVGAYHALRDLLRSLSKRSTVLATSHSPILMGMLDAEREIVVLERDAQGVHARSLEDVRRREGWLNAFENPGEAFTRFGMERR